MNNLISQIKETTAKAQAKYQADLAEQKKLKNEQDNNVAQSTFDSLMQEMVKCEGTSGYICISMQASFGRIDFLKLVVQKLDAEGFVAQPKTDYAFRYEHPKIPGLSIWSYSNKDGYGSVESNFIRWSFV